MAAARLLTAALLLPALAPPMPAAAEAPERADGAPHGRLRLVAGRLLADAEAEVEPITDVTGYCLDCHDGPPAPAAERATAHGQDSRAGSHPVDLLYPETDPEYRAVEALDPALVLLEGKVTCITCHAHDEPAHAPVLATEGSQLCRACHLD